MSNGGEHVRRFANLGEELEGIDVVHGEERDEALLGSTTGRASEAREEEVWAPFLRSLDGQEAMGRLGKLGCIEGRVKEREMDSTNMEVLGEQPAYTKEAVARRPMLSANLVSLGELETPEYGVVGAGYCAAQEGLLC
ncbi:unnamed protein product [Ilex paraguariensis]|uniref:Uncharacterized protein n=1 Tax=Ilex paraguariensis TaxID=185542 RepID=A0ABC8RPK4_9AQUA